VIDLAHALRLAPISASPPLDEVPPARLAFVGAGGKSRAMFSLGKQLVSFSSAASTSVLLTSSTHLGAWQLDWADHHLLISSPEEIDNLPPELPAGTLLLTRTKLEGGRVAGLDEGSLEALHRLAEARGLHLLIEADGSRQRPLKAPAQHEPVIPPWVNAVVVVAGLEALGKPLNETWVHRPQLFSALSGLQPGEMITREALTKVLMHPQGGLKNIPTAARRILLLNTPPGPEILSAVASMADGLLDGYMSIVIATLSEAGQPADEVHLVRERVAGIVLAAGGSNRYGRPKQLLEWRGEPFVRHAARLALQAGLSPLIVVTGAASEEVQAALDELPVACVHNPDWESGQSTSLRAGVLSLPETTGAAVFLLSDQPHIPLSLVRGLMERHQSTLAPIVAPLIDEQRGNPALFDRGLFSLLGQLSGDTGGRQLFSRVRPLWVPWHDPNALLDVDTPQDYARLLTLDD